MQVIFLTLRVYFKLTNKMQHIARKNKIKLKVILGNKAPMEIHPQYLLKITLATNFLRAK